MSASTTRPTSHDLVTPAASWALDADAAAPGKARRLIKKQLRAWRLDAYADDAALIVSELTTNAVRLGLRIRIALHEIVTWDGRHTVQIGVTAPGPGPGRHPALPGPEAEHGRGLPIIDTVSHCWGTTPETDHDTTVWAHLPQPSPSAPAHEAS